MVADLENMHCALCFVLISILMLQLIPGHRRYSCIVSLFSTAPTEAPLHPHLGKWFVILITETSESLSYYNKQWVRSCETSSGEFE